MPLRVSGKTTLTGKATKSVTAGDPLIDNVTSIVNFEAFAGNTTIEDSISGATWSAQDQATVSNDQAKFGASSSFTTGTATDRWTAPYDSSLSLLNNDFCVEIWVYPTSGPSGFTHLLGMWEVADGQLGWHIGYSYTNQALGFEWTTTGTFDPSRFLLSATSSVPLNQWTHIALVRNTTTLTAYINGVDSFGSGVTNIGTDTIFDSGIGLHAMGQTLNSQYFAGHVDSWRVTIGNPRYTADFTPPTQPFPTEKVINLVVNTDPFINNVTSIVKFEGFPGNTSVTDSISGETWTAVDQAAISSDQSITGNTSAFTTGTATDKWTTPRNGSLALAGNDFCVEAWIQPLTAFPGTFGHIIGQWEHPGGQLGWDMAFTRSGFGIDRVDFCWTVNGNFDSGRCISTSDFGINLDQWNHIAVCRSGPNLSYYVNGVLDNANGNFNIGSDVIFDSLTTEYHIAGQTTNAQYFAGYIDSTRVTIGNPRYTADFTPPTQPFPTS